jgi:hypothetical protein
LKRWLCAALTVVALGATACGDDSSAPEGLRGKDIEELDADLVPGEVFGLQVTKEKITDALAEAENSYVESAALFAFRSADLLQATLQVSRFSDEADPGSSRFRSQLVNQIGGTRPQQIRVGQDNVYLSRGNRQRIAVWFKGESFYILSTREDFDRPRGLLRQVLELDA